MIHEKININEDGSSYLVSYIHEHYAPLFEGESPWQPKKRPAIIFAPGGAFRKCSPKGGDPMAFNFLRAGFNVFTLYYALGDDARYHRLLSDASMAVCTLRRNAEKWHIDPDKIAIGGFSAGGTVAAILATEWNSDEIRDALKIKGEENKPDALILGYAPLVFDSAKAKLGKTNLQPGALVEENRDEINVYRHVGKHTPPTFIWHTASDTKVPSKNALYFASALEENNIPYELHIFQDGEHGLYTATDLTMYGEEIPLNTNYWIDMCIAWLRKTFEF